MSNNSANNFAARWDGYAVFAPALQRDCAEFTQKPKRKVREGKTPGGLSPRDLDFLNAKSALYVSCQRLAEANDLIFHPTMQAHQSVPANFLKAVDVVERVFVEERWESLLSANADLLDSMGC